LTSIAGSETLFRRPILGIQHWSAQIRDVQDPAAQDRLPVFVHSPPRYCHLGGDFPPQVRGPGVASIFLKTRPLAGEPRHIASPTQGKSRVSQLQSAPDVAAVQSNRPGDDLLAALGFCLLDLTRPRAVIVPRNRDLLMARWYFVSGFSELLLFEIAIAWRQVLFFRRGLRPESRTAIMACKEKSGRCRRQVRKALLSRRIVRFTVASEFLTHRLHLVMILRPLK